MSNDTTPHHHEPATSAMVSSTSLRQLVDLEPEQLQALVLATDEALEHQLATRPPNVYLVAGVLLTATAAGSAVHGAIAQAGVTCLGAVSFLAPWVRARRQRPHVASAVLLPADDARLLQATQRARAALQGRTVDDRRSALLAEVERQLR